MENERRQLGLPSRVRFSDHSSDQFTASTTLRGQNSWECVTTKLILQVRESILFIFHSDPLKTQECSFLGSLMEGTFFGNFVFNFKVICNIKLQK